MKAISAVVIGAFAAALMSPLAAIAADAPAETPAKPAPAAEAQPAPRHSHMAEKVGASATQPAAAKTADEVKAKPKVKPHNHQQDMK